MPLRAPKGFIDENSPEVSKVGHPAPPWLAPYADLMTELVCFFVILYALSAALNKNVQNAAAQVKEMMDKGEMKGDVKIDKEGLKITLQEQGDASFFGVGSSDTTPEMEEMMAKLTPHLKKLSETNDIIVEGHTDSQGISNDYFDSNWELSTARATSVARLMIDKFGFPPQKMGAIGYGQYRPIVPNDTPENRSRNRRVVFFVKNNPNQPIKKEGEAKGQAPPSKKEGE
jgi:flagellar motor protein MotB